MSKSKKWGTLAALCVTLVALAACGAPASNGDSEAAPSGGEVLPGSLQAGHTEEMWATIEADHSKKMCLSCHPRETIVELTADYGGAEGYNPHAPHTESYDCIKCHSLSGENVLVCNTACHGSYHGDGDGWPLPPENWQDPTDGLPSADGEGIPLNS